MAMKKHISEFFPQPHSTKQVLAHHHIPAASIQLKAIATKAVQWQERTGVWASSGMGAVIKGKAAWPVPVAEAQKA